MHFGVLVVSKDKPTEQDLYKIMGPWCENDGDNPEGHWDWLQLGGRWTGTFKPEYKPEDDPANKKVCYLCQGTGTRTDMKVENGCNGCSGTGIMTEWPTHWKKFEGDQIQAKDFTPELKAQIQSSIFAIVKDCEWHEHGWESNMAWAELYNMLLDNLPPDIWLSIVDCHT